MLANAPRNAWYPLTWSRNVGRSLSRHKVLGVDLVVYRTEAGAPVALDDVCPHRLAPLSMGRLRGDALECGYHGMTFGTDGRCIRIPGQPVIPGNARVASYPVAERMGLVWIWPGDPARADVSQIYDLPQYHSKDWRAIEGDALHIGGNYLNLADNLTDPAHVSFVHLSTLGNAASEEIPVEHAVTDTGVVVWRWIRNGPAIPLFAKYGDFTGPVDRWHYYHYLAPCIAVIDFGSSDAALAIAPEDRETIGLRSFSCHFITPVDEHHCIDHWLNVRNFKIDDAEVDQRLLADLRIAFDEDKLILEEIDRNEQARPDLRGLRLGIDAAPQKMRRVVERMIAEDSATPVAAE